MNSCSWAPPMTTRSWGLFCASLKRNYFSGLHKTSWFNLWSWYIKKLIVYLQTHVKICSTGLTIWKHLNDVKIPVSYLKWFRLSRKKRIMNLWKKSYLELCYRTRTNWIARTLSNIWSMVMKYLMLPKSNELCKLCKLCLYSTNTTRYSENCDFLRKRERKSLFYSLFIHILDYNYFLVLHTFMFLRLSSTVHFFWPQKRSWQWRLN